MDYKTLIGIHARERADLKREQDAAVKRLKDSYRQMADELVDRHQSQKRALEAKLCADEQKWRAARDALNKRSRSAASKRRLVYEDVDADTAADSDDDVVCISVKRSALHTSSLVGGSGDENERQKTSKAAAKAMSSGRFAPDMKPLPPIPEHRRSELEYEWRTAPNSRMPKPRKPLSAIQARQLSLEATLQRAKVIRFFEWMRWLEKNYRNQRNICGTRHSSASSRRAKEAVDAGLVKHEPKADEDCEDYGEASGTRLGALSDCEAEVSDLPDLDLADPADEDDGDNDNDPVVLDEEPSVELLSRDTWKSLAPVSTCDDDDLSSHRAATAAAFAAVVLDLPSSGVEDSNCDALVALDMPSATDESCSCN